jgi:RiboL-PSP-HEPN
VTFEENVKDVERLIELHEEFSGTERGRRVGVEVLNKAAVVFMCAGWEAYVEDLADEVVQHYVNHLSETAQLPVDLRKTVARELEAQSSKVAVWKLAGDGWKKELRARLKGMREKRNLGLNTPKTDYVDQFFERAIGVSDVPTSWSWRNMTPPRARRGSSISMSPYAATSRIGSPPLRACGRRTYATSVPTSGTSWRPLIGTSAIP